jgi:hypothetical protein
MNDALETLCRAYLDDRLSAAERIRFESRLASGDQELLSALDRVKGIFPKNQVTGSVKMPRQMEPESAPVTVPKVVEAQSAGATEAKPEKAPETRRKFANRASESLLESPEKANDIRQTLARAAAIIALVALIYASYLQWQLMVTRNKLSAALSRASVAIEAPTPDRTFVHEFELGRLKAALTADQGKLLQIPADRNGPFKKAFLLVDFSTNRTLAMVRADSLPLGMKFAFWIENREYDMNPLGFIDRFNPDSVYTDFDGSAFIHGRFIEVHLQSDQKFDKKNRIGRIKLP